MIVHDLGEVLLIFDFLVIDGNNQVAPERNRGVSQVRAFGACAESRLIGSTAGGHLDD